MLPLQLIANCILERVESARVVAQDLLFDVGRKVRSVSEDFDRVESLEVSVWP